MKKVFIVVKPSFDCDCILGAFDTFENAVEYAKTTQEDWIITSCEINNPDEQECVADCSDYE